MKKKKVVRFRDTEIYIDVPTRGKLIIMDCLVCGLPFGIPDSYYHTAVKEFGEPFYCSRGHSLIDVAGTKKKKDRANALKDRKRKEEEQRKEDLKKNRGLLGRILFYKIF